jgi:soluble lytic murein transglycosylase-like protein
VTAIKRIIRSVGWFSFLAVVVTVTLWFMGIVPIRTTHAVQVSVPRSIDIGAAISKRNPEIDPQVVKLIATEIARNSERYQLDPALIVATMGRESDYRLTAESSPNPNGRGYGVGIMQANPVAWPELFKGVPRAQWFHLAWNTNTGCKILAKYIKESPSLKVALTKYSGGKSEYANDVLVHYSQMQWEAR